MNSNSVISDEWEDCPKGTLQAIAKRSRQQRTMKRVVWAIPSTFVILLALGGWLPSMFSLNGATLACDQVVKMLPAYASNTLTQTQRTQVERHLSKCQFCAEKLRTIQSARSVAVRSGFMRFDQLTRPVAKHRTGSPSVSVL